jgi:type II secretory pathway pseudopilin PulG
MRFFYDQKGFTFIETLVGFAILGAATYAIMTGLDQIEQNKNKTDKNVSLENLISSVVEASRSNIIMEKVDFQANETFLLNTTYQAVKDSLKMCWVNDGLIPIDQGMNCQARLGYVVTPLKTGNLEQRGLYQVTIRITHDELFPNQFRQYQFIVRGP